MISSQQIEDDVARDDVTQEQPIQLLRRAYYFGREKALQNLSGIGVTERQAAALRAIAKSGPMTQTKLGAAIGMEPANVHGLIERLREKDLVSAERDPTNSKQKQVSLTRKGRLLVSKLLQAIEKAELEFFAKLTPQEQGQFLQLLAKIVG